MRHSDPRLEAVLEIVLQGEVTSLVFDGNSSEELAPFMDQYKTLVGDGLSSISVSTSFGTKEYGNGVSVNVSISLVCGQDQGTISAAVNLAGQMARWYAREQHKLAETEYQKMLQEKQPNFR